jgi:hypothetical protein
MKYKKTLLVSVVLIWGMFVCIRGQSYEENHTKTFTYEPSKSIEIHNKYGKVHVASWNKDSVQIKIHLHINSTSYDKLQKLKNSIDFDFTHTKYYIIAKTDFENRSRTIFGELLDIAESIVNVDNDATINYEVRIPKHATIKVVNKFGDVFIDDLEGQVTANLSNGQLKANNLNGTFSLELSSSDANINNINEGTLALAYSNVFITSSKRLNIDSRSSNVNIDEVNYLNVKSRRDRFDIPAVTELYGDSYFSIFNIKKLNKGLSYDFKYGDLRIEQLNKNFSFLNITSEYTDLELLFERGASFQLDITRHADVTLNYPRTGAKLTEKEMQADDTRYLLFGTIGNPATADSKVKINALKKCDINIFIK